MNPRRVVFVTGTRADFGKLKPLMRVLAGSGAFQLTAFTTGMHMLARHGMTVNEVIKSGLAEVFPFVNQGGGAGTTMEGALATTVQGLSHFVRERAPDLLVVHGDRVEALAGAIVGALNNVLVAHVEGGELSGTVDELIRHAVSKMSHVHFVANEEASRRLRRMGERADCVHVIGSPDIDVMISPELPPLREVLEHYAIPFTDYGILLYHPVTTNLGDVPARANRLVDAVLASGRQFVVIAPNNDHGAEDVLRALRRLDDASRFRHLPSLRFEAFLVLLREARAIVGNSSAGIREAPVYGIQTINLGTRQKNRFNHSSILDLEESDPGLPAALAGMGKRYEASHHFGDGRSAARFLAVLQSPQFWAVSAQKQFDDVTDPA
jgi:UDP-N-acetylglucosamine 2-epimerase (hydrolysing)